MSSSPLANASTDNASSDASADVVDHVRTVLPEFEFFPRRSEPDSYGASYLIAQALGKDRVPRSFASWKHGWPHANIVHPVQLAQHGGRRRTRLVPRPEHVDLLSDFGYTDVHAVGLPFVYAEPRPVKRIPDSLLVMPPHTLPYLDESWDEEEYADAIAELKSSFSTVVACVHRANVEKGQWTKTFRQRCIDWVPGTRVRDKHGLVRMHTLFSMFEYMTTNTIGSHVPYAAYCGCKVSMYGPFSAPRKEDYRNDPTWSKHPDVLEVQMKSSSEASVRRKYPFLFVDPDRAEIHRDWAAHELGADYRRPPCDLADLLGWAPADQVAGYLKLVVTPDTYVRFGRRVRDKLKLEWSRLLETMGAA